jgi:hypothetical protein
MDVRVEGPAEAIAYMDAPQERQALLNLAMNAVETSASDSVVCWRAQNEGEEVRIDLQTATDRFRNPSCSAFLNSFL